MARDYILNRFNLQKKEVDCPLSCVLCGGDVENTWHKFISCLFVKSCWSDAEIPKVQATTHLVNNLLDFLFKFINFNDSYAVLICYGGMKYLEVEK